MKKKLFIVTVLILLFLFSFVSSAENEIFNEQLEASGASDLFSHLNDEQLELLEILGIEKIDFNTVFEASPRKVLDLFYKLIVNEYLSPFKACISSAVMLFCAAIASVFVSGLGKSESAITVFCSLAVSLNVIVPISECLTRVISAVLLTSDFMLVLIPVLAAVLTVSGNPTAALSYNSLCFVSAQLVSSLMSDFIRPLVQMTFSIGIIAGISQLINLEKIVSFIKKTVMFLMSLASTVFITMLSIKGMLAASADTVAVRGVRFLIGNLIPVVGGAVSDAYNSIAGTLILVKNTVGVIGIAVISVTVLPVITECVCWILSLNLLSALSDVLSLDRISSLFKSVSSSMVLLAVTLVFSAVVFVLSIGLVMLMKGGG